VLDQLSLAVGRRPPGVHFSSHLTILTMAAVETALTLTLQSEYPAMNATGTSMFAPAAMPMLSCIADGRLRRPVACLATIEAM
jgi:hypothetical protein